MAVSEAIQTISRLTPLADVLTIVDAEVKPVTQRTIDVTAGAGRALAADAMAPARRNGIAESLSPPAAKTPSPGLMTANASARPPTTFTASIGATLSVPAGSDCPTSMREGVRKRSDGA